MIEIDARLEAFCREGGFDGVVIRRRSNVAWAAGGADIHVDGAADLGVAALVWGVGRKVVLTNNIEAARLGDEEPFGDWEIESVNWWEADLRVDELVGSGRFACDWPDDCLQPLRESLTEVEVERVRALGADTAEVVGRLMREDVVPGMTERHLGGAISGWLRDRGIYATVVLIAADERIRKYRHPIPTGKGIEKVVMAAVCAQRHGLIVSVTRLVHFGKIDDELRRRHEAVCAVDLALYGATRVGARWCDVLGAGVSEYEKQGFKDEWKKHHQGGPMGYEARDFLATPSEEREVKLNQLVGWNPSITGTKSEDTVLVGSDGVEVVTVDDEWPEFFGRRGLLERGL